MKTKQILKLEAEIKVLKKKERILIKRATIIRTEHIYTKRKRIIKQIRKAKLEKVKYKPEKEKEISITEARVRRQVALNFVNRDALDSGLVFVSIRAITINPVYTSEGLKIAIREAVKLFEEEYTGLREYESSYTGIELKEISPQEDRLLNDMGVWIEFYAGGKVIKLYRYE